MKEKRFYLIYQITNNVNGKIYIGKHETNNLDDDYFGSGKYLNRAKEKYGLENFTKTVLFFCHNQKEMNLLEKCVVTPEFCQRDDVYNLNEGGDGGWSYVNLSSDYIAGSEKRHNAAMKANSLNEEAKTQRKISSSITKAKWSESKKLEYSQHMSNSLKMNKLNNPDHMVGKRNPMFNVKHSNESKQKMSLKKLGKKNIKYGTHWWTNPATFEIRQFKDDEVPKGWFRKSEILNKDLKHSSDENQKGEMQVRNYLVNEILKLNNSIKVNVLMTVNNLQLVLHKLKNPQDNIISNDRNIQIQLNKIENQYKLEQKIKLINELYPIYCKYGWEEVLKIHPFKCSVFAFIQQCKKYAKGYDPLNRRNKKFPSMN